MPKEKSPNEYNLKNNGQNWQIHEIWCKMEQSRSKLVNYYIAKFLNPQQSAVPVLRLSFKTANIFPLQINETNLWRMNGNFSFSFQVYILKMFHHILLCQHPILTKHPQPSKFTLHILHISHQSSPFLCKFLHATGVRRSLAILGIQEACFQTRRYQWENIESQGNLQARNGCRAYWWIWWWWSFVVMKLPAKLTTGRKGSRNSSFSNY